MEVPAPSLRLTWPETVVIIVLVLVAAVLVATGAPVKLALTLMAGAAMTAVGTIAALATSSPRRLAAAVRGAIAG